MSNENKSTHVVVLSPWVEADEYLSSVVKNNYNDFVDLIESDEDVLSSLPEARKIAREKNLDEEALNGIADWFVDDYALETLNLHLMSLFFCQKIEHTFASHFAKNFKKYVVKEKLNTDSVCKILRNRLLELEGATAERMLLQKWG